MTELSQAARWVRAVSLALLLFIVLAAASTARALIDGQRELEHSTQAFNQGDLDSAILYARRAASSYVPGAPHVDAAYARLRAIALGAESNGDRGTARLAWDAVRSAALESRHLWTPRKGDLETANRKLELLRAAPAASASAAPMRSELPPEPGPRPAWSAALAFGFLLSIAGLSWLGFYASRPDGTLRRDRTLLGLAVTLAGAACWTVSLYWA
jgi:hypothetical protein